MQDDAAIPVVGVVTVTYNSAEVLDDFLDSLIAQEDVEIRLYAVDNASGDDSVDRLRRETRLPHLFTVANETNVGVAQANNQGIETALRDGCDWVLLLNNDTMFPADLVHALVRGADADESKIVAPVIEATEPPGTIWYAGGRIRGLAIVARHLNVGDPIASAPTQRSRTGYASTCCLLVHPDVFAEIGLMDPDYFVYFDDLDFAVRAIRAGYDYWLDPAARLTHKASALTGGKHSPFTLRWTSRNWPLLITKRQRGIIRLLALAYVQIWAMGRLLLRRDDMRTYVLRQRGFREGVSHWRSKPQQSVTALA